MQQFLFRLGTDMICLTSLRQDSTVTSRYGNGETVRLRPVTATARQYGYILLRQRRDSTVTSCYGDTLF